MCCTPEKEDELTKENRTKGEQLFSGKLGYRLTNDFMFKAVLQKNETALKGLLCALLGMEPEMIKTVRIMNPIEIGKELGDKWMILDLKLEMNDNCIMDIEMQVLDEGDWPLRSLAYLSRSFDQLGKGDSYKKIKETIHIGILDFTPEGFPKKLYLDYYFYNLDTAHKYSDKMSIRVLQLNQLGRKEDEAEMPELYHWAQLFKADTWEEMRMLAEKNAAIRECVVTYKELSEDEMAQMLAEVREDYYRRQKDMELNAVEKGLRRGIEKGLRQGIEQGLQQGIEQGLQQGTQQAIVSMVEHAMQNLSLTLEQACEGLGVTVEAYQSAKNGQEFVDK